MAYELTPWKKEGLDLSLVTSDFSVRKSFSSEINRIEGEGGGLNADYRTVEAVAMISSVFGAKGLVYERDFIFKTARCGEIKMDFRTRKAFRLAVTALAERKSEKNGREHADERKIGKGNIKVH